MMNPSPYTDELEDPQYLRMDGATQYYSKSIFTVRML